MARTAALPVSIKVPRSAGVSLKALIRTAALPVSVKVPALAIKRFILKSAALPRKVNTPLAADKVPDASNEKVMEAFTVNPVVEPVVSPVLPAIVLTP